MKFPNKSFPSFLKFYWDNTKVFWYFAAVFVLVFHVLGYFLVQMPWRDIWPFYVLIAAIGLTFYAYDKKRYKDLKREQDGSDNLLK